ncbi:MAG: Asp-tRNA(Asn)/Glu-tRNA(Gln) amidotransferase subunit GatA [Acidimicrobiales bacterium]|jgi:aspartyl-tRNA(Asn)/glutamyl-tRNA(Gln) amidotransferase subunit A|nr:Asp-tRNA(Asn)/Glu-tRNA(Gln) amidotransferase subunit GatA [Acidimicrobiales bacterium]MDP6299066.1 Asp-tRNA(Asn)/Glu-tRNA(Gln) amidotransferase subunit GatA [Acidimicrobiales bacterium]HJM28164.1 Asp-tRNA(Asn)/Glu-tRNA(Gln) amidotransferase subunit GatA [Acidimicrobiales bacterium]HJM97577.1 Asp-tRNA(Asn)/Glu-tRNA(Gln) amidotransferase subunit GatA [Acidimicrobiales bacterium]
MTSAIPDHYQSASSIAANVASGEISAAETLEQYLNQIEDNEKDVHAFNLVTIDEARALANEIDKLVSKGGNPGPLAGVPVAIKDNLCTRGIPTTASSKILQQWKPPYDATVVRKLKEAGATIIGKTNLDEFAMGSSTENSAFGPTRNPHDFSCVPGGSSGGSAAAVAAGFAPIAIGSDTGGSIRQPASLCGVVGVKPTYGGVSRYGLLAFASSLDQVGPFANSVKDAAIVHEVIGGFDPLDSTSIKEAPSPFTDLLGQGINNLKVGVIKELMGGIDGISDEVIARANEAVTALSNAGAQVEEVSLPAALYCLSAYYLIAPAEASSNLSRYDGVRYGLRVDGNNLNEMNINTRTEGFGDEVKRRIMLGTYALSAGYYDAYYGKALKVRRLLAENFADLYKDYDVLLSPTSPCTAFKIGEKVSDPMTMYVNDVCTIPSNLVGHPAISVPFGIGSDGMPIGIQILAPPMNESVMYQVAETLEQAGT